MNSGTIIGMMIGLFAGNLFFYTLMGSFRKGLAVGLISAVLFPILYIPVIMLLERVK